MTALMTVPSARVQRALAIVNGIVDQDELEAKTQAQHEEDVLQAKQFAHAYLNHKRASEKYRAALEDIKSILTEATKTPASQGERVITMMTVQKCKDIMHNALASTGITGGVDFRQKIIEDINTVCKGMDIASYIN